MFLVFSKIQRDHFRVKDVESALLADGIVCLDSWILRFLRFRIFDDGNPSVDIPVATANVAGIGLAYRDVLESMPPKNNTAPELMLLSELIDRPVYCPQKEVIGTVSDFLVEFPHWQLRYAVVLSDHGASPILVPLRRTAFQTESMSFDVRVSESRLIQSPRFNPHSFGLWEDAQLRFFHDS